MNLNTLLALIGEPILKSVKNKSNNNDIDVPGTYTQTLAQIMKTKKKN